MVTIVSTKMKKMSILFFIELILIEFVVLFLSYPSLLYDAADIFTLLFPGIMCLLLLLLLLPFILRTYFYATTKIVLSDHKISCKRINQTICCIELECVKDFGIIQQTNTDKYWYVSSKPLTTLDRKNILLKGNKKSNKDDIVIYFAYNEQFVSQFKSLIAKGNQ